MNCKKSQITIFIIVGIFLIVVFSLIFFMRSESTSLVESVETFRGTSLETALESCVKEQVEYTISALFLQGGILYEDQGGFVPRPSLRTQLYRENIFPSSVIGPASGSKVLGLQSSDGEIIPLNYGILRDVPDIYRIDSNFKRVGPYTRLVASSSSGDVGLFSQRFPFFGTNGLPKLCNRNGANNPESTSFSCHPSLYNQHPDEITVQSQLESALSKRIVTCFDETIFDIFDFSFEGDGATEVLFGDSSVTITSNYTITQFQEGAEQFFTMRYSFPIRVKKLYTAAYLGLQENLENINFKFAEDLASIQGWDSQMTYIWHSLTADRFENYYRNDPAISRDGVLVFQDRSSLIGTNIYPSFLSRSLSDEIPLTLLIATKNRRPYLEVIPNQPADGTVGYDFTENAFSAERRTIQFVIEIYDPDDYDAEKIYRGEIGSVIIEQEGVPEFISQSDSFSRMPFPNGVNRLPSIPIPSGPHSGPIAVPFVLACSRQCNPVLYQNFPYAPTIYTFRATVSDGQFEDYQIFELLINPS